jgi:hypothetical protein
MVKTSKNVLKQIIPNEEYEFDFDQDDVFNVVPFKKTTNKQVSPSSQLFKDLPIFALPSLERCRSLLPPKYQ